MLFTDDDRHWVVFASSWLVIIATAVVPAVQNSMFVAYKQVLRETLYVSQPALLAPLDAQRDLMTNNFLLSAYSIAWLGQTPPEFSTNEYTFAPFSTDELTSNLTKGNLDDTMVIARTTRYWSELTCWPPALISVNLTGKMVSFHDGKDCNATDMLSYDPATTATYDQSATYEAYLFSSSSLGWNPFLPKFGALCPKTPHLLLATWRAAGASATIFGQGGNATALFCQADYYSEPVNVTLMAADNSVVSYNATGSRSPLSDNVFNRTHFEYIATSGAPPREDRMDNMTLKVDVADASYLAQETRIQNMRVVAPSQQSNDVLIGFALALTRLSPEQYLDPVNLSTAYNKAYQLLFVHALRHSFDADTISSTLDQKAVRVSQEEAIRLVPGFTIATELLMGVMCVICIHLLISIPKRTLRLSHNPDCFAETMLLSRCVDVQDVFSRSSSASEQSLQEALQHEMFELENDEVSPCLKRMPTQDTSYTPKSHYVDSITHVQEPPKHSLELSWATSGLVLCLLFGAVGLLIALKVMISKRNGLRLPHVSGFVQQLLLNFLPTTAATLLAIYLTLLCRSYSFIKPMHDLLGGCATARSTLLVKYTSTPPHLLFVEAFRARHYLLAVLSIAALFSSMLTVTTASIFVLRQTDNDMMFHPVPRYEANVIDNITSSTDALIGVLPGSSTSDAMYSNIANMSDLTPLPTWTIDSYGFLPVDLREEYAGERAQRYLVQSLGYGADLQCQDLQNASSSFAGNMVFQNNGTTFQVWANFTDNNGSTKSCVFDTGYENDAARFNLAKLSNSDAALEISNPMKLWNGSVPVVEEFCANSIVKGWVRARMAPSEVENDKLAIDHNATIILCQPRIKTRQFSLNTTPGGDVVSAQPLGSDNYLLPPLVNLSASLMTSLVIARDSYHVPEWHNDTVARDWSNYLYHLYLGDRKWLDPSLPPPSAEDAAAVVSEMFSRIFAVQLFLDRDKLRPFTSDGSSANRTQVHETNLMATTSSQNPPAKAIFSTRRIFMSDINFFISIAILVLDLVVILVFRLSLPKPFLPRMPFTIASQIAFFAGSHVIDDVVKAGGDLRDLDKKGYRYAYGQYIGKDGWLHTGIERDQFVTKL